jgi:PASTA domain
MRYAVGAFAAAFLLTGCGEERDLSAPSPIVPDVVGWNLDDAQETLATQGLRYAVQIPGGSAPLIDHLWWVCSQQPPAGAQARLVTLYAEHTCD